MPSKEECKRILFQCGLKLGVSPNLLSNRLLSDKDKTDMMGGLIDIESLEAHTEVWRDNGMPDYAHGKMETLATELSIKQEKPFKQEELKEHGYRKPFAEYRIID